MNIVADPPHGVIADVDARAIQQAVANLLDNALRYGPAGQSVRLDLEPEPDAVLISVRLRTRKRSAAFLEMFSCDTV